MGTCREYIRTYVRTYSDTSITNEDTFFVIITSPVPYNLQVDSGWRERLGDGAKPAASAVHRILRSGCVEFKTDAHARALRCSARTQQQQEEEDEESSC